MLLVENMKLNTKIDKGHVRGEMSIVETYAETPAASTTALKVKDFIFGSLYVCG